MFFFRAQAEKGIVDMLMRAVIFSFFSTISTSEKMFFFSERKLEKALRDMLTQTVWTVFAAVGL